MKSAAATHQTYIVRESHHMMGLRILLLELVFLGALLSVRMVMDSVEGIFQVEINEWYYLIIGMVHLINIGFLLGIVFTWSSRMYVLKQGELIVKSGVFSSQAMTYDLSTVQSISLHQSWLGMIFRFGSIEMFHPILQTTISLTNINNPKKYLKVLQKYEKKPVHILSK